MSVPNSFGDLDPYFLFDADPEFRANFLDSYPHPMLLRHKIAKMCFYFVSGKFFWPAFWEAGLHLWGDNGGGGHVEFLHLCYVLMMTRRRCSSYWAPNKVKVTWDPRMNFWTASFLVAFNSFDTLFIYRNVWMLYFCFCFST